MEENINIKKAALAELMARRPRAFGWTRFQKFLFWLFLLSGALFFIATGIIIFEKVAEAMLVELITEDLPPAQRETAERLIYKIIGTANYLLIIYNFIISILFFILARYCQKLIARNNYILKLEAAANIFTLQNSK